MEAAILSVTHKKKSSVLERPTAAIIKEEAKAKEEKAAAKEKDEKMEVDSAQTTTGDAAIGISEHKASTEQQKRSVLSYFQAN